MNYSIHDYHHGMTNEEVFLMFKGIFRDLSPLQIPLSIIVLVQNTVIFMDFYKERAKFVSSLFMGIALADILKAQGDLILSVISILDYSAHLGNSILYKSLFYYMITALPGINCSKLFNLVLTITLTCNIVNPFRVTYTALTKKVVLFLCLAISVLH